MMQLLSASPWYVNSIPKFQTKIPAACPVSHALTCALAVSESQPRSGVGRGQPKPRLQGVHHLEYCPAHVAIASSPADQDIGMGRVSKHKRIKACDPFYKGPRRVDPRYGHSGIY